MLQCWRRTGYLPFFIRPHPGGFAIQGKRNANARGSTWWGGGEGAGGIDLEWNILHRVDSLSICTPKNSKHLRLHWRAIMALDHSRLDLENQFLDNKSGRFFLVGQVYFKSSCQQIWGCVNQPFIHHIWGETILFIIHTSDRIRYFTIFEDKLHSVNVQDDQSWAFSETVQKLSEITHTASRFSFLVRAVSVVECLNEL